MNSEVCVVCRGTCRDLNVMGLAERNQRLLREERVRLHLKHLMTSRASEVVFISLSSYCAALVACIIFRVCVCACLCALHSTCSVVRLDAAG